MAAQHLFQAIQAGVVFTHLVLEPTQPLLLPGKLLQPGIGRCQNQQSTRAHAPVNHAEETAGRIEPVYQVAGKHQVVAAVLLVQVAGVRLHETAASGIPGEAEFAHPDLAETDQVALVPDAVAPDPSLLQLHGRGDEAGGEIEGIHVAEVAGQLEGAAAHRAADVEGPAVFPRDTRLLRPFDTDLRACPGKVRYTKVFITVVEFQVLGYQFIRFVGVGFDLGFHIGFDIAKAGMLEKVPAECVARLPDRVVARGDETAAFDQIVLAVEGRSGKVVIDWVDPEPGISVDRGLGPLPDIADDIVELAAIRRRGLEPVHRAGRRPVFQVDVARCLAPVGLVCPDGVAQAVPFGLGRQADALSRLRRLPVAEGLGLQVVHVHRPVPGHVDDPGHAAVAVTIAGGDPEFGMDGTGELTPLPALLGPVRLGCIATLPNEGQVLAV